MRDLNNAANHIVRWLKQCAIGFRGFVVGVSGGVDSALVSVLCAKTYLPTVCLSMPIHQAENQHTRALAHIKSLLSKFHNVYGVSVDLSATFDMLNLEILGTRLKDVWFCDYEKGKKDLASANARSRLRMVSLYEYANRFDLLVVGTGNKVEDGGVRFFTKYGDGGVDLSPIGDLLKTEVWAMARTLGVSDDICTAKPTDGLWSDNRGDEDQIGATYPELEEAMAVCETYGFETVADFVRDRALCAHQKEWPDRKTQVMRIYLERHAGGEHKMHTPPVCKIV